MFQCCTNESVSISQGAAGFPGGRGLPGPPGNNVSKVLSSLFSIYLGERLRISRMRKWYFDMHLPNPT